MYHIKEDQRSISTANFLYEALTSLLLNTPFAQISVSLLTQKAEVGRSSFYRNFDSIIDILRWKVDSSFHEVIAGFLKEGQQEDEDMLIYVFNYWSKKSDVLETLIKIKRIDIIYDSFRDSSVLLLPLISLPTNERDYFLSLRIGIFVSVFSTWLTHNKKESPHEVASLINKNLIGMKLG